ITNKPFIEHLCKFNKPIILSTGAANLQEIREAVSWIDEYGNDLSLLHCVLNYPTSYENANLGMIYGLKKAFPSKIIGYSDHTFPGDMSILETAFLLGARIIEKHFTFDKNIPGNDHYHSMDKEDLKIFIQKLDQKIKYIGKTNVDYIPSEELSRLNARRSLVALKNIPEGKIIDKFDLTWKRPGIGVSPKFIEDVIGKTAKKNIQIDEIIKNDFYE
ncbi:MAG: N-acetylneuraminate synthase family protein, partial [Bacteroidales bacterium]|nr:N-acetylneuraminate synthase family protein [Bacteroidales bacterium]